MAEALRDEGAGVRRRAMAALAMSRRSTAWSREAETAIEREPVFRSDLYSDILPAVSRSDTVLNWVVVE
jgi:hypothetical protein